MTTRRPVERRRGAAPNIAAATLTDSLKERLVELRRRGYNRLFQGGQTVEFSTPESLLELDFSKPIFVLVDRLAISPDVRTRLVDAIETGYRESGEIRFLTMPRDGEGESQELRYSSALSARPATAPTASRSRGCSASTIHLAHAPRCQGFGNTIDFDLGLIIPDKSKSLDDNAVHPWASGKYRPDAW